MKREKRIALYLGLSLSLILFGTNKTHAADSSERKVELSLPVMPSNGITSVSLSPNQQFLLTNHVDGGATAWRVTDRAHIRRLSPSSGLNFNDDIILDDGSVLMNDDYTHVVLKDLASGDTKQTFSDGEPLLKFSYAKSLGLVAVEPRGVVRIWDLESAKSSEPIPLGCDEVGPIAVSSDGEYLAALCNADSSSDDTFSQYVRLWTIATRSMETWKLPGNYSASRSAYLGGQNNALLFRDQLRFVGHYLMLSSSRGLLFPVQGQLKLPADVQNKVFGTLDNFETVVTPSGDKIVCAEISYLWDAYSKVSISIRPPSEPLRASPEVFSSDFSHIFVVNSIQNSVDVYNLAANAWESSFATLVFAIRDIAVSSNGERVATTSIASLRLWDMSIGNEMTRLLDGNAYMKLGTSSTEQYLTAYLLTKPDRFPEIRRMSLRNGTTERSYRPKGYFEQLVLSPDGSCFVTKLANHYSVYSSETGDEIGPSLEGPKDPTGLIVSNQCDSIFIPVLRDPLVNPLINSGIIWNRQTNHQLSIDFELDLSSWAFSPDVKLLASTGSGGRISLWSTEDGNRQMITVPFSYILSIGIDHPIVFSPKEDFFLAEFSHQILRIHTHPLRFDGWCITQPTSVTALAITPDGQTIISGGEDGTVRFWSEAGQELVTAVGLDDRAQWDAQFGSPFANSPSSSTFATGRTRWLSFDRENHFDTSNFDDTRDVHWIASSEPLELFPLEALMQTNFQPNLLALRYHRKPVQEIIEPSDLQFARPTVKISIPKYDRDDKTSVSVTVEITKPNAQLKNKLSVDTSVRDLRLFRDHQLIREMFFEADKDSTGMIPKGSPTCKEVQQSETMISVQCQGIRIPHFVPLMGHSDAVSSDVQFSAYAFNKYEIKGETFVLSFHPDPIRSKRVKPSAYVIAVGVNANDNCYISLKTAASDARRTASFLSSELSKTGQFSKVVRLELTSDYSGSGDCYKNEYVKGTRTTVNDATTPKIKAVFETLAGERPFGLSPNCRMAFLFHCKNKIQRANPGDVIIFSFSGHGDQDASGLFHLFPADTHHVGDECLTDPGCFRPHMFSHSISSDNLRDWVRDIDAVSLTFILDTCHSGEAIESDNFKPAPMGSRALGELAFSKGMRVLVASSAAGLAADSGLLTESLLDDGIRLGGASSEDGTVRLSDLLTYATRDVPDLYISKKIGDIPQKPQLFDFDLNEVDPVVALRKSDSLRITSFNDVKLGMPQAPVLWALQNCCMLKRGESELQWNVYDKRGRGLGAIIFARQIVSQLSYGQWQEYQTSTELALAVTTDLKGDCKSPITIDEGALNARQAGLISENVTESVYLGCSAHREEVVIFKNKFIVTQRTDTLE